MSVDEGDLSFPSPFMFHKRTPVTLVELRMRHLSGKIRQKARWWEKVQDSALVAKWRSEMIEQDREVVEQFWGGEERFELGHGEKQWPRETITPAQLDYIFDELRYEAQAMDKENGIYAATVPMVYESQYLIPPALTMSLLEGVSTLESVPDKEKDWHPDSDGQVLDLVHPSLYFLRIGHTHVLNKDEQGPIGTHVITEDEYMRRPDLQSSSPKLKRELWALSNTFQWIPTDFRVSPTGDVTPLGYINNLHPTRYRPMYPVLSSILERFVPLFESVLSAALSPPRKNAIDPPFWEWYDHVPKHDPNSDVDYDEWERTMYWPEIPDPSPFVPPQVGDRCVSLSLKGRTIQVIVKLANILLTPEKPEYPCGSWHVEGMTNERIVATGVYYYACENISESRLSFCATVGSQNPYATDFHEQDDNKGCMVAYGFGAGSDLNQTLGHIVAEEGKCVAFPNVYQHQVQPFRLADPTRPGHRKILCFFLVDPFHKILSTSDVPPQQEDWWDDELIGSVMPALQCLPEELYDAVSDDARRPGTISRQEAEQLREKFMEERSDFSIYHSCEVFQVRYNMCEH
ncbi:hypothetical protein C8Q78DRAFT_1081473 [Trametes maxima]|nr:hypothetical protein C8Q78DRAFT_1081473 [Trametes maxima]